MYINGAVPTNVGSIDLASTGINLHSGDIFNVAMTYDGTTLSVTITDTVTKAQATQHYTVSIGPSAYVGFTAGTGGDSATQEILNWTFTSGNNQSAPTVVGVYLAASSWDPSYFQYLDSIGLGNSTIAGLGFAVFGGNYQLQTLPWLGLNTLNVLFSGNLSVAENSLTLIGSSDSGLPPLPAVTGFSYNSTTHVATWTFASPLKYNRDLVNLASDSIVGNTGLQLDGAASGSPGSDFNVTFYVLPGDTANQQTVTFAEAKQIVPSINLSAGDAGYDYRKDVLGLGTITLADAKQIINYINNDIGSIDSPMAPPETNASVATTEVATALTAAIDTAAAVLTDVPTLVAESSADDSSADTSSVTTSQVSQVDNQQQVAAIGQVTPFSVPSLANSADASKASVVAGSESAVPANLATSIPLGPSPSSSNAPTALPAAAKANPVRKLVHLDDGAPAPRHIAVHDRTSCSTELPSKK